MRRASGARWRPAVLALVTLAPPLAGAQKAPPAAPAAPASAGGLTFGGDVLPKTVRYGWPELLDLDRQTAEWTADDKQHTLLGIPLAGVLARAGFRPSEPKPDATPEDKRAAYQVAIVVTGGDGQQAVLSAAELTPGMGFTQAMLIFQMDGASLPAGQGPLKLVVLSDGNKHLRSVRSVARIDLISLRRMLPPAQK